MLKRVSTPVYEHGVGRGNPALPRACLGCGSMSREPAILRARICMMLVSPATDSLIRRDMLRAVRPAMAGANGATLPLDW